MRIYKINKLQFKFKDSFSELSIFDFEKVWEFMRMHDEKVQRIKQIAAQAEQGNYDGIGENELEDIGKQITLIKASILQYLCFDSDAFAEYAINTLSKQSDFHEVIADLLNGGFQKKKWRSKKDNYQFSLMLQFSDPATFMQSVQPIESFELDKIRYRVFDMDAQSVMRVQGIKAMILAGDWSQFRRLVATIVRPAEQTKEIDFSNQSAGVLNVKQSGASIYSILDNYQDENTKQIDERMEQFKLLPFEKGIGVLKQFESFFLRSKKNTNRSLTAQVR